MPISFTVTILGSEVPFVGNQVYARRAAPLQINYDPFKVLPDGYNAGPSNVEAYMFIGNEWPTQIDLTCSCLVKIG